MTPHPFEELVKCFRMARSEEDLRFPLACGLTLLLLQFLGSNPRDRENNASLTFVNSFIAKLASDSEFVTLCAQARSPMAAWCELEALSFLTDEQTQKLEAAKHTCNAFRPGLESTLKRDSIQNFVLNEHLFRLFIAIALTVEEWQNDIAFFDLKAAEQLDVISESPMWTLKTLI